MIKKSKVLAVVLGLAVAFGGLSAMAQLAKPPAHGYTKKHLYDETIDPRKDIAAGLKKAKAEHKRVILDFGGDWCGDCQVLDIYFHDPMNAELLEKNFVVVHVFIGHMDKNLDLASKYGVPVDRGVPALAVIDSKGKPLYSQQTGQFSNMRYMDISSVHEFLVHWKA